MKNHISRNGSIILALILVFSLLAGCTSKTQQANNVNSSGDSGSLIAKTPITLKYFIPLGDKASQVVKSNAEIEAYQEMEKKTGVKIEWIHPTVGKEIEQLNLLIASQTLPDLIFVSWDQFPEVFLKH